MPKKSRKKTKKRSLPRMNTGGKSVRLDVAVSPELYEAIEQRMEEQGITKVSEFVRFALAAYVNQPELGEGMKPGRRWPDSE